MFDNKRIMVVVAHPDDELLGLGATMHNLIFKHGVVAHVVILGEGITSRSEQRDVEADKQILDIHRKNIFNAQKLIGYQSISIYNLADNRFDSYDLLDVVKIVEKEKKTFNPEIIFTHNGSDLNIDHRITFQAVITATRPMKEENVKNIITFETPSCTEWQASNDNMKFSPNLYYAVTEKDMAAKINGMKSYEFESRSFPHPRSSEALTILAKNRAVQVGRQYAEAFQIIRIIL